MSVVAGTCIFHHSMGSKVNLHSLAATLRCAELHAPGARHSMVRTDPYVPAPMDVLGDCLLREGDDAVPDEDAYTHHFMRSSSLFQNPGSPSYHRIQRYRYSSVAMVITWSVDPVASTMTARTSLAGLDRGVAKTSAVCVAMDNVSFGIVPRRSRK